MLKVIHRVRKGISNISLLKRFYLFALSFMSVHKKYILNRSLRSPFSKLENDNKIIFIHIPKAAGNALIKTLFNQSATGHDPLLRYKKNDLVKYTNFYKFSVVRNPWDRLVSAYFYLKQGGIGFFDKEFADKFLNDCDEFNEFVLKLESDPHFLGKILSWVHFCPQVSFLQDETGRIAVDRVVKLEYISSDISLLCKDLNLPDKQMVKDNQSKRGSYQDYYTEKTKSIVAKIYKEDIQQLGYNFE